MFHDPTVVILNIKLCSQEHQISLNLVLKYKTTNAILVNIIMLVLK